MKAILELPLKEKYPKLLDELKFDYFSCRKETGEYDHLF